MHTFFDGVAIAAGFMASGRLGLLLALSVLLHKLPEGVTVASLMVAGGHRRRAALAAAAVVGLATVLGVVLTESVAPLARHGLALAAGVTLYVAASGWYPRSRAAGVAWPRWRSWAGSGRSCWQIFWCESAAARGAASRAVRHRPKAPARG